MSENLIWIKSTYSGSEGGQCVEIASISNGTAVRDSKDPDGPVLRFTRDQWRTFVADVKAGRRR
ncbi:MAG TPA: DUF397 domain-containing protein [Streptosporangiaceae bacterium]|nr:DUF397 domain-containing protein [Streptosporangiaceae bacterium]